MRFSRAAAVVLAGLIAVSASAQKVTLTLDATDVGRRMLHSKLTIPAVPGPFTLLYPKWIPGEHGPSGPIVDLVGVQVAAGEKPLAWQRDPSDMFAFRVVVPDGASSIDVTLDFLTPVTGGKFSSGASVTSQLAVISWNTALLYPSVASAASIEVEATLKYPAGWKFATALRPVRQAAGEVTFAPVSLVTLIDSPVLLGANMTSVPLKGGTIPHQIEIAADSPAALELPENFTESYERLVAESGAIFGARPYARYHWLVALSDSIEHFGLEHHESSDNRMGERTLLEEKSRRGLAGLLAHEFAHTWNGKFRRPADMVLSDYQQPLQTELLWVYEGLTTFLGALLPARSGLWEAEHFREALAQTAAELDVKPGRAWRPLADTAVSAQTLFGAPSAWASYRRGADFYSEMTLVWLEADTIIRQKSGGKRSLDDFMRAFHGGRDGSPDLKPYTFDDIVAALNGAAEHDWAGFLTTRVRNVAPRAPLAGIENAGWRLVYTEK
ncbi:MAG: M61 family peptidase, partial [Thermoanaerobaculia bacterium]